MSRTAPGILELPKFRPRPPWLGGDLQTVRNFLLRVRPSLHRWPGERLEFPMDDGTGDVIVASLHRPQGGMPAQRPLVVVIHGLTGCEDSAYVRASARHLLRCGFPVMRLNLRGAGPSRPLCRQTYHAGRSDDLHRVLCAMDGRLAARGICVVGFSVGGNILLKYLGEMGRRAPVLAAATVSAPIDLAATERRMRRRRNSLYHDYILAGLKREASAIPGLPAEIRNVLPSIGSLREFDERLTAPTNGFTGAEDYYERCKAVRFMPGVTVPTLVIHALNDPWIPAEPYLNFAWSTNPRLLPLLPRAGGHVGFHGLGSWTPWHDRCIAAFFARMAGA